MKMMYDAAVIGGGAAGLTAAGISANFGAKTIMIEQDRLGGDCTWTGCVPSKTLIKAASVLHSANEASKFGLKFDVDSVDTAKVMKHVDQVRREIYEEADKPEIFKEMGIDVEFGEASFVDTNTLTIKQKNGEEKNITARYFFICTGAKAFVPPIKGIENIDYLTNESLFEIDDLPKKLIIVGAGPIGTEMAQSFQRLGTEVNVLDMAPRILMNDDPELTAILKDQLEKEGVTYSLNVSVDKVEKTESGVQVHYSRGDESFTKEGDAILFATGRRANIDSLDLEKAGVQSTQKGIAINEKCRTNQRHIYAIGDVTGEYQFTHMSEHMAKVATSNALIKIPMKIDRKHLPWVTYTDPEVGQVGATEEQLREMDEKFEVYRFPFNKIDRAITDGNTTGLIKVFAKKWSGKILGASIVGAHAGEMISQ
ncbi:MAG: FAD-dependent oxidoreductase, partial [Bacteroidetes bacterium]|nr:FAD-dependent oxidoreductase [Bacteroidota bacterium]